jgi:V/A-type H+-transporting ATPase subunit E
VKRALLNSRKEVLDEVYEKSKESLIKLPPEKNQNILKNILDQTGSTSARIYSNAKDKELVKKFTKLKHAGEIECIGGVILENESGTESLDFRYEMILKNVSEQSLKQVSDILFG